MVIFRSVDVRLSSDARDLRAVGRVNVLRNETVSKRHAVDRPRMLVQDVYLLEGEPLGLRHAQVCEDDAAEAC